MSGVVLLDRNPAIIRAVREAYPGFRAECTDLLWDDPVEVGEAVTSVADPPWYPEHIAAFLWAAARATRFGGQVLLSLPPEGTRPGILDEREAVLRLAAVLGLRLESLELGVLAYLMPPFERNALIAAGVPAVADDWRRGDLAVFVRAQENRGSRPPTPAEQDVWDEVSVGSVRIKCRRDTVGEFRDPTLSQLIQGDMLPSVSRRQPVRGAVDVWTCGNRVFRCAGADLFLVVLTALGGGEDVREAVGRALGRRLRAAEGALVRQAAIQAADLVRREQSELSRYGHQSHECHLVEAP
jgi:hypothetical protein